MPFDLPLLIRRRRSTGFSPASLFAAGEAGVWFDPSDLSTMFQESTGVTPVTAAGQSVGLILDKSRGLAVGPDVRNLGAASLVGTATAASFDPVTGIGSVTRNTDANNQSFVTWNGNLAVNGFYRLRIQNTGANSLTLRTGTHTGTATLAVAAGVTTTCYIPASAAGTLTITSTNNSTTATFVLSAMSLISGSHATASGTARPTFQQSSGLSYLDCNGTSNVMLTTATVNFSAAPAISLMGGFLKNSDAARGIPIELGVSATGGVRFDLPNTAAPNVQFTSIGGTQRQVTVVRAAPYLGVITGLSQISTDTCILRLNGVQAGSEPGDQGSANYANAVVSLCARSGANFFNGRIYGAIMRGSTMSANELAATEAWLNTRTGAY